AAIADDQDLPHRTSVVDLKFPSFLWQPRLGTSNPNHTRFQRVASVLSNPKFAQIQARDAANFGFGTLDQRFELCGDLVPALTALPRQRLCVIAPPEIVIAKQSDRRARKAVVIAGDMTGHPIDNALDDAAAGNDYEFVQNQRSRHGGGMVAAGRHQGRLVPCEATQKARLLQIAGWVMQPEQPPFRTRHKPDHAVTAIADVEIAFMRNIA